MEPQSSDRVDFRVKLVGVEVAKGHLRAGKDSVQIVATDALDIRRVKVKLKADFQGQSVWASGSLYEKQLTGDWKKVKSFKKKIFSW